MSDKYKEVSLSLQHLAGIVSDYLAKTAGEPIAFVLLVSVDKTAQYVSNASREDGRELIESLLARWRANRADIPAHYNPDLSPVIAQPVTDVAGWKPIKTAPRDGTQQSIRQARALLESNGYQVVQP
jgi:hypothetical protein